jgi:3'(2'), 5'-bisphosphate nucleotidase
MLDEALIAELTAAVGRAAAATLGSVRSSPNVRSKPDRSPVTDADMRAQSILLEAAARLMPGIPAVSEEMTSRPKQLGDVFLLIDPLDGTKEYVAGSSEFTVNLAVIERGTPLAGVVAVPADGLIYRGVIGRGAERLAMRTDGTAAGPGSPIRVRKAARSGLIAAVSRSHLDAATVAMLDRLGVTTRVACGSALKFCRVAEGAADVYPRLAPTCEWDVAAGHALVAAAGGTTTLPDGGTLIYGATDADFRISAFVAWGDRAGVLGEAA